MNIFRPEVDRSTHIIAEYYLRSSKNLRDAAWALAVGQSVGNPSIRSPFETPKLFEDHCCKIIGDEKQLSNESAGRVLVAFPVANINIEDDGISQVLCHLMGGQLDIDTILSCQLWDLFLPPQIPVVKPRFGISKIREFTGVYSKPILGGIMKPKTGIAVDVYMDLIKEMVDGGVNFIKEDEILGSPDVCPFAKRMERVGAFIDGKKIIFAACINANPRKAMEKALIAHQNGVNAMHLNFWSGFGTYCDLRQLDLPMYLFFQKSGDKILTNEAHAHHVKWSVICKLAAYLGVDFIHAGMWGGYMSDAEADLAKNLQVLRDAEIMPSLSCGMHPGLVRAINKRFGVDYMANVGGAVHGHPSGTKAGVMAMRQAIDGVGGTEYEDAVAKWGIVE
jgi:ribulose 1,5-bisphosphate carboxylase large subunit-like protein